MQNRGHRHEFHGSIEPMRRNQVQIQTYPIGNQNSDRDPDNVVDKDYQPSPKSFRIDLHSCLPQKLLEGRMTPPKTGERLYAFLALCQTLQRNLLIGSAAFRRPWYRQRVCTSIVRPVFLLARFKGWIRTASHTPVR